MYKVSAEDKTKKKICVERMQLEKGEKDMMIFFGIVAIILLLCMFADGSNEERREYAKCFCVVVAGMVFIKLIPDIMPFFVELFV